MKDEIKWLIALISLFLMVFGMEKISGVNFPIYLYIGLGLFMGFIEKFLCGD